jgi:20S proteasome subunit beta 6
LSLGTGAVYSYDPVGSYERESIRTYGSASDLIQPFMDSFADFTASANQEFADKMLIDAFNSATERDIHTGDSLILCSLAKGRPVKIQTLQLRKD